MGILFAEYSRQVVIMPVLAAFFVATIGVAFAAAVTWLVLRVLSFALIRSFGPSPQRNQRI